jgi:hypothetical protein
VKPRSERNAPHSVLELTLVGEHAGIRKWAYVPRGAAARKTENSSVGVVIGMMASIVIAVHLVFWMIGLIE